MAKRMTIDELEMVANNGVRTSLEFLDFADVALVDYLAFEQKEQYWSFNFGGNNREHNLTAHSPIELEAIIGGLMLGAAHGKPLVPKDVSFGRRYNLGIDEVLISAYYTTLEELGFQKPKAITISSTTDFGLGKELVHVDKVKEIYGDKAQITGKDPLMLLFEDNKMVIRPATMFRDNMPRYNLNLKYLVEASKLMRQDSQIKHL